MTEQSASGDAVVERVRAANIATGDNSSVEAMLANSLREGKPLADDGALHDTIQDAQDAASAFVFAPPATFDESVTIDTPGLTLLGTGESTTISAGAAAAISTSASNVSIENLAVQNISGGSRVIQNSAADSFSMKFVTIKDGSDEGFRISPNSEFIHCRIGATIGRGALVGGSPDTDLNTKIIGCTFDGCGDTAIDFSNSRGNIIMAYNLILNIGNTGIGGAFDDAIVIGNRIHNCTNNGISTPSNANDNIFANNRVSDCGTDLNLNGSRTVDGNLTGPDN